ncbi:MAG: hemerythrin domain-containing protein [Ignavibacterium sp.]|nr:hemerythrin domain-containing protein [Ignavibacterium sp.]
MQLRKTDLFTFIHKAIRSIIYDAASNLQSIDFADINESGKLLASLQSQLELLHEHAVHEDNIVFPEIQINEPEMVKELNQEHKILEEKLNQVKMQIEKTDKVIDKDKRLEYGAELNAIFNDFAANYLAHMNHEEATVLEASFKYLSDEELVAIRTRIQTKIPPERYKIWLHWMLKSLNKYELIGLLGGMKSSAPPQVFENVIGVAESVIENEKWSKIKSQLVV